MEPTMAETPNLFLSLSYDFTTSPVAAGEASTKGPGHRPTARASQVEK
jgi:hypothetical protein